MRVPKLIFALIFIINIAFAKQPNIVIIYVDDLGYGDLSCYGATDVHTPNIDKLADNGVLFTDAHSGAATCTPSRYTLLTGNYAFRVNADVLQGDAPALISPETPTIASMLKTKGYRTAVIGKWHLGLGDGNVDWNSKVTPGPLEIGFDYSYLIPATGDRVPCAILENHYIINLDKSDPLYVSYNDKVGTDPTAIERPELVRQAADSQHGKTIINGVSRIGYMSGGNAARWKDETLPYQMLHKARTFIDESAEQAFFLYFSFHDIHVPRLPGHQFEGSTKMGPRGDAIVQMDYITGQLVDYLKEKGVMDNTLIVFSSDNGPVLNDGYEDGAVDLLGNHQPSGIFRGGKYSNYEAGTRVPTIVHYPALIQQSKRSDALIGQVDIYASLAELVNYDLKENEALDSKPILNTLLGRDSVDRSYLLEESFSFSYRRGEWKYIKPVTSTTRFDWIKARGIEDGNTTEEQLYNISNDIREKSNVAVKHPDVVKLMRDELNLLLDSDMSRKEQRE